MIFSLSVSRHPIALRQKTNQVNLNILIKYLKDK